MSDRVAISVKNVKKDFILPHEKVSSIKSGVVNVFKSKNKTTQTQHALRGVSFEVKQGEFFGILGRNGSGKSTLLKILAEIYQPTRGKVGVHGKLVPFIELGVGFNPELTGRENVYLNGALLGFSKKEIDERYQDIVEFAELEDFMDQKLKNYSSGMQVRLAFSVATRAEADILLVDEVLAVGDADFQRKCYDYFKSLKKSGKTVVFVTHDMGAVKEYCDRAVLISDGKVAQEGVAEDIADEYLKLFNANKQGKVSDVATRWGAGGVQFDHIKASITEESITVDARVTAERSYEDIIVAVRVSDASGKVVAGASTKRILKAKFPVDSNQSKSLTFTIPNVFGFPTLSIGGVIASPDRVTIFDDWSDVVSLSNPKEESYYSVVIDDGLVIKS